MASIQRQIVPGFSASAAYFRRWYGNLLWNDNALIHQSDYTPFTIANPIDGSPLTLYNLAAAKRGLSNTARTFAPDNRQIYNGVDFAVSGRFHGGGLVNASAVFGRTDTTSCTVSDPNALRFCET